MRTFAVLATVVVSIAFSGTPSSAQSDSEKLLDLLVEKGVATEQEAAGLKADLAASKQAGKEEQKEFTLIAGKPIKLSGYTQLRYQVFQEENKADGFDIRRARLDLRGSITDRFEYRAQVDFGGNRGPFLLDATIGYKFQPYFKLTAGQTKIPFSQENLTSSPKLETINRSQVVEALVARGRDIIGNHNGRDIGVQAGGSIFSRNDTYLFDYALGVFNGTGINTSDLNERKDVTGRVVFHPIGDLSIGGNFYAGEYSLAPAVKGDPPMEGDRDRIGAEFAYIHDPITVRGEYIAGQDGDTDKEGWYVQGGYFVVPKKVQGVVKYDVFDPDTNESRNRTNITTLGLNWYFNKWAFLQADYEIRDEQGEDIDNNVFIGQFTLQF
jgi:phosphate-selective porin